MATNNIQLEDDDLMNAILQELEVTPDTTHDSGAIPEVITGPDTPAQREKLAILVSTGKSKDAIGVQLTHEQVKRLTDKQVEKYYKRYEAYVGNKTTESLIDSVIMFATRGAGLVVKIGDVEALQKELKNDYMINHELSNLAGGLALRCGRFLALANAVLITTKHIDFKKESEVLPAATNTSAPPVHHSRDAEGYPLEGFDEVDECFDDTS